MNFILSVSPLLADSSTWTLIKSVFTFLLEEIVSALHAVSYAIQFISLGSNYLNSLFGWFPSYIQGAMYIIYALSVIGVVGRLVLGGMKR